MNKRIRKQKADDFARKYHSLDRVEWIKAQGCCAKSWRCSGPIHNAHTEGGGMGYKAGWETVVPLCAEHHRLFDQHLVPFHDYDAREDMQNKAVYFTVQWLKYSGEAA